MEREVFLRKRWSMRKPVTQTEDEIWESNQYNEIRNLCYNDLDAWNKCVRIVLNQCAVFEHLVRRSELLTTGL